jgi:hypothetical protein
VSALPADSYASIPVAWSGSDNPGGSGLDSFNLFVAVNDGPFEPWLTRTRRTGALYSGAFGNRYAFHSVATDVAGTPRDAPVGRMPQTTVTLRNTAPTLSVPGEIAVSEGGDSRRRRFGNRSGSAARPSDFRLSAPRRPG